MEIEIFTLCDAATDSMGKLNILGTFDTINVRQLPVVHPSCAVALRIRFTRAEEGGHRVAIHFKDEANHTLIPSLNGNISIKFGPQQQTACANLILNLNNLKFEKPGHYTIDLSVNGESMRSLPVFVNVADKT